MRPIQYKRRPVPSPKALHMLVADVGKKLTAKKSVGMAIDNQCKLIIITPDFKLHTSSSGCLAYMTILSYDKYYAAKWRYLLGEFVQGPCLVVEEGVGKERRSYPVRDDELLKLSARALGMVEATDLKTWCGTREGDHINDKLLAMRDWEIPSPEGIARMLEDTEGGPARASFEQMVDAWPDLAEREISNNRAWTNRQRKRETKHADKPRETTVEDIVAALKNLYYNISLRLLLAKHDLLHEKTAGEISAGVWELYEKQVDMLCVSPGEEPHARTSSNNAVNGSHDILHAPTLTSLGRLDYSKTTCLDMMQGGIIPSGLKHADIPGREAVN